MSDHVKMAQTMLTKGPGEQHAYAAGHADGYKEGFAAAKAYYMRQYIGSQEREGASNG